MPGRSRCASPTRTGMSSTRPSPSTSPTSTRRRPTSRCRAAARAENSPGGTIIATAHGIDPDAGAALHLFADRRRRRPLHRSIRPARSPSSAARLIDYETASSYHVKVRATDQYGLAVEKDFTLHVTDAYEGPTGFGPVTAPACQLRHRRRRLDQPGPLSAPTGRRERRRHGRHRRLRRDGVLVSLATGGGEFASPVAGIANCTIRAGGWTSQDRIRGNWPT